MRESIALEAPGAGAVVAAGQVAALRLRVAARQPQAALVYVGAGRVGPHHRASGGAVWRHNTSGGAGIFGRRPFTSGGVRDGGEKLREAGTAFTLELLP
jgi:hypothetical protein